MSHQSEQKTLIFDLEADGLLKQATKVHCIALCDATTGDVWSYGPQDIERGLEELYAADTIVAHNGTTYDLPLLKKLYGWNRRPASRLIDTLVVARLLHPNIKEDDYKRIDWDKKLIGSHSLRAWGLRLGEPKDDYDGGWEEWSEEMEAYCRQDVKTTFRLLNHLRPWEYPAVPLQLEHRCSQICHEMWENGWKFDIQKAQKLHTRLIERKHQLETALVEKFGQWQELDKILIPKRDNKKFGYVKDVPVEKYKTVVFNPGSRVHIEKKLTEAGWVPTEFTDSGRAKLDEPILNKIKAQYPEAQLLVDYMLCQKRLGQLSDGDNGWLRLVEDDGCIHGTINPLGTQTGRATHAKPNLSQVPANRAEYGHECRELFTVPEGWKLVGCDFSGLELRIFAHYLSMFDKGEYAKVVVDGDVHSHNQKLAGLETRDQAKTYIYATLYGASPRKIALICGRPEKEGYVLKDRFMRSLPAYAKLLQAVTTASKKGWVKGLDDRMIYVRSEHSALNFLLQGAGGILAKQALINIYDTLLSRGYTQGYGGDFVICGWSHDEFQVACREPLAETVGEILKNSMMTAGEPFGFKVRLDAESKIGNNWSETH